MITVTMKCLLNTADEVGKYKELRDTNGMKDGVFVVFLRTPTCEIVVRCCIVYIGECFTRTSTRMSWTLVVTSSVSNSTQHYSVAY